MTTLKDNLSGGLSDDICNFIYYGGDYDRHLNYFNNIKAITKEITPAHSSKCACGHDISRNGYVKHKTNNKIFVVGSCCINRFMSANQKSRKCVFCNSNHKNYKNSICNDCRKIYCNICYKKSNSSICYDCDIKYNNKKICKECNCIINDSRNNYCKECRVKCYLHNTYHSDNIKHDYCYYCEDYYHKECKKCKHIITFGKYNGLHFDELKDNNYLMWCFKQYENGKVINGMKRLVEYYKNKFTNI